MVSKSLFKKTYPNKISWTFCSTRYQATNTPSISSPTHEMYIPQRGCVGSPTSTRDNAIL